MKYNYIEFKGKLKSTARLFWPYSGNQDKKDQGDILDFFKN